MRDAMLQAMFSVGGRRVLRGLPARLVRPWAAAVSMWVIYSTLIAIIDPWELVIVFLTAMLPLVFLTTGATASATAEERPPWWDWAMALLSLASGIYFWWNSADIVRRIPLLDPLGTLDVIVATVLILVAMEAVRRTTGLGLLVIVMVFLAYNFFGQHLGGLLWHGPIGYEHFLDLTIFTTDGMLGLPLRVAATYAFLFVMFGTFLAMAGGSEFFFNVAAAISGRQPGGPAKIAVVSSGLYGTMSGSPTSDVVTTGAVTIPMMKRLGYPAALAGAFEVTSSTGGGILPPVMGSAAFIMAEYTGIEYREIAAAALIPALLFYVSVYAQVHYCGLRMGLRGLTADQIPKLGATLRNGGLFVIPLVALIVALLAGYSPNMVAMFGAVAVIGTAAIKAESRLGLFKIYDSLAETTLRMAPVTGACAAAGLVIGGITLTGLAMKFSALVALITGGQFLFLALLVAAAVTILLGMGMPTPSAYILAAVLIGPLLTGEYGVPVVVAHMFILYFAVMSAITPPVAVAAYAAAPLAEANPLHIAVLATRLAIVAFIIPFVFVYSPELLLIGDPAPIALAIVTAVIGVWVLAIGVEGYFRAPLSAWRRLSVLAGGICLIVPSLIGAIVGAALLSVSLGPSLWRQAAPRSAP